MRGQAPMSCSSYGNYGHAIIFILLIHTLMLTLAEVIGIFSDDLKCWDECWHY